jgi:RNA polymerase sigma-70 factor (ECF subfamily)
VTSSSQGERDSTPPPQGNAVFATTHWSVVLTAGTSDTTRAHAALANLCQTYWRPLYAYVRRRGYAAHDSEDLTQAFFARLLERKDVATVNPERGRFRSYLLGAMNHFLCDEWDKARAQKRGGGRVVHLDTTMLEEMQGGATNESLSPEKLYDQRWAITVLEEVHARLRSEQRAEGKGEQFEALRFCLMGERSTVPYAEIASRLGMTEGAVKVAVHRLRRRYRILLREFIADTVATPDDIEDELQHLLKALSKD